MAITKGKLLCNRSDFSVLHFALSCSQFFLCHSQVTVV